MPVLLKPLMEAALAVDSADRTIAAARRVRFMMTSKSWTVVTWASTWMPPLTLQLEPFFRVSMAVTGHHYIHDLKQILTCH
jgi:hypothetical protein